MPTPICRKLLAHATRLALSFAFASAGNSIAARIAMMAMTTSNSIKVKARRFGVFRAWQTAAGGMFVLTLLKVQLVICFKKNIELNHITRKDDLTHINTRNTEDCHRRSISPLLCFCFR
jgi:hypothetical protein